MDRETVDKVARLARLDLTDDERALFQKQLGDMLEYARMIERLDTADAEPFMHASSDRNVFRADEAHPSPGADPAVANAPARQGSFFTVPRVVEGSSS